MPRHVWSIPCQTVLTDQESNLSSYIRCVEAFTVSRTPVPFPPLVIGTLWVKSSKEDVIELRIRVMSPEGDFVSTRAHPRTSFQGYNRYRINLRVGSFDITAPGEYTILTEHKEGDEWKVDSRIPIFIDLEEPPEENG
jgi:hypothetical protein